MARSTLNSVLISLLFLSSVATLCAQSTLTRLEGDIQEASGRPIAGATVTAEDESTSLKAEAAGNDQGHYVFPGLRPGTYTISVKANGFKSKARKHVEILQPGTMQASFKLQAGDSAKTDQENAARESRSLADAQIAGTFSERDLNSLPLLGRDPLSLVVYEGGVQIIGGNESSSTVNGNRQGSNSLRIDGVTAADPVNPRLGISLTATNPDAIREVQVVTAGARAEYGHVSGGQIALLSRSGGKTWSGNLFDYFRNSTLSANDFFNNSSNTPNPRFMQNLFGGSISGSPSEKTFLFANYQGGIADQKIRRNRLVLSDAAKGGIFQWFTPGTTNLQSYNIVANDPRKLGIDPTVAATLAGLPSPTNSKIGDGLNTAGFQFDNPADTDTHQATVRLDHNLNPGNRLFLRLSYDRAHATDFLNNADPRYPGALSGIDLTRNWGFAVGWDWDLGPRKVNELRAGYMRPTTSLNRDARAKGPMLLSNSWTDPLDPSFPSSFGSPTINVSDYFTLAGSRHTFKFGGTIEFRRQNLGDANGIFSNVTFGQDFGNSPPLSIGPSGSSVISAADRQTFVLLYNDLLGRMESVVQTFNSNLNSFLPAGTARTRSFSFKDYAAFVQDDWRIRPNLMLSLGVRYEIGSVPNETNGIQGALDQASAVTSTANINGFAFVPGKSWYSKDLNNFAPRIGFAWDILRGKRRLVMRGGAGIFYDNLIGATTNFVDQNSPGLSQTVAIYPNLSGTDVRLQDGIPSPAPPSAPVLKPPATRSAPIAIFDPNLRSPYVQQFYLSLQKELFSDTLLEAAYVGIRGKRLFMDLNLNQTKIEGDFLQSFKQIQAFRTNGTPVPPSNTLVRLFGSTNAAITAIGGSTFDSGQVGVASNIVDGTYFTRYPSAGLSDFYLRNFTQFSDFIFGTNSGSSSFDSLQAGVRRTKAFYMVSVHYTWSKAFDNISSDGAEFVSPADNFNPGSNRAPSDFDRRHIINGAGRLSFPIGKGQRYWSDIPYLLDAIIGGWNLSALGIWESGARFSVTSGLQTAQAGFETLANYSGSHDIGEVTRTSNGVYWFSPDQILAFSRPAAGERGTSGRNSFVGPRYVNLDVALYKTFRLRERRNLAFRGEVYNILNRAHFTVPNSSLADPSTFGKITATQGTPRIIQLALRLEF